MPGQSLSWAKRIERFTPSSCSGEESEGEEEAGEEGENSCVQGCCEEGCWKLRTAPALLPTLSASALLPSPSPSSERAHQTKPSP